MGTAASSSKTPQRPLFEEDAFEIATHWHVQLRDWISLSTHDEHARAPVAFADEQHAAVRHFEWVTLGFPGFVDSSEDVAVVRAAHAAHASTVAWLAISSCAGFSGRENPRFWKRVFAKLWAGNQQREIAEEVRFFEHPDRPFPCVRIKQGAGGQKRPLRAFFRGSATDRELHRVLRPLAPYLTRHDWWRRVIPVEIVGIQLSMIAWWRPKGLLPKLPPAFRRKPAFHLVAVRTSQHIQTLTSAAFCTVASEFGATNVLIPQGQVEITATAPSVFLLVHQTLEVNRRLYVETLRPRVAPPGEDPSFTAMCSALPHTHTVSALELKGTFDGVQLNNERVAWLGYALFHPDTADKSALTAMILGLPHVYTKTVEMLRLMATGNNLLLAMGATTTTSSAYHEARLAPRTRAHADGDANSRVLYTFSREQSVTLCVASVEEVEDRAWVCIVVPGVGLGWVDTKQIIGIVSRAPGLSPLRRLALSEREYQEGQLQTVGPQLLSLFGASLTHLEILAKVPAQALQAMLRECPKVIALRVYHDGDCWSDSITMLSTPLKPRLRTLELFISGPFQPLVAAQLDDLTTLRVVDQDPEKTSFAIHREALLETLGRYPRLVHVYWSSRRCHPPPWWETSGYRQWWTPKPWANQRDCQSTSYRLLGESVRDVLDVALVGLPLDERLAFLSICGAGSMKDGAKWLPRLTADVVRLIFAFNSMTVPRQLLIKHNNEDPCE